MKGQPRRPGQPDTNALRISGQISWVYTEDLDKACVFYRDVLGLELSRDEGSARIFKTGEGAFIGVCLAFEDRVVEPAGGMITLVTDVVDEWYADVKASGADVLGPPRTLEKFGIYGFFIKAPDGYIIEIQQFIDKGA